MNKLTIGRVACSLALAMLGTGTASAALLTTTYQGTVSYGDTGAAAALFGLTNSSIRFQPYTVTLVFDTGNMSHEFSAPDATGTLYDGYSGATTADTGSITINGITISWLGDSAARTDFFYRDTDIGAYEVDEQLSGATTDGLYSASMGGGVRSGYGQQYFSIDPLNRLDGFSAGHDGPIDRTFSIAGDSLGLGNYGTVISTTSYDAPAASAVPEPASWGMMICGLGLVGAAMRRGRRAVAAFGA